MEKISSGSTFFTKVVFPAIWFGFLAVFMVAGGFTVASKQPIFIIEPLLLAVFGYFFMRKFVWELADEVRDGGSFLLVRKGAVEVRVPLANVMNIGMNQFGSPQRLTLRLRTPCELGDEIAFIPKLRVFRLNPFARNPVAEDLMRRVDDARRGKTT